MLAYLGHKGRQAFGSNALAAHGKGAYLPSERSKRGSGGEVGLAVDLLTEQVKSRVLGELWGPGRGIAMRVLVKKRGRDRQRDAWALRMMAVVTPSRMSKSSSSRGRQRLKYRGLR